MKKGQLTGLGANLPTIMILLLVGLIILAIIINEEYELPSNFKQKPITGFMGDFFLFFGIPPDWLYVPAMIYLFFVPFLGIFVIVYGFLSEMNIFPAKPSVNVVLALLFAFATVPIGGFVKLVSLMFAVLGLYSTGAFGLLFFFGVIYVILQKLGIWGFTTHTEYRGLQLEHKYNRLRRWMLDTYRDNSGSPIPDVDRAINKIDNWLISAENKYNSNSRKGLQYLQSRATSLYATLKKHNALVRRPPV